MRLAPRPVPPSRPGLSGFPPCPVPQLAGGRPRAAAARPVAALRGAVAPAALAALALTVALALAAATLLRPAPARAADAEPAPESRVYETRRVAGPPPRVDGLLDDPAWDAVSWSGDFLQRDPLDGAAPIHPSQVKVLYDDQALYFAFRLFDDPSRVAPILARRDWFPGDWIEVNIDSRADERTAYSFTLSLSGSRGDEYISEDGNNWNGNWDPVWQGATHVDDQGWTAEMRIPLSQLRFDPRKPAPWGLQVHRHHFRDGQHSTWQRIPRNGNGWVSRFGDLRGLTDLAPGRRLELLPSSRSTSAALPRRATRSATARAGS